MPPADRIEELKKKFDENPRRYFAPLANEYRKAGDLAQAISICRTHLPQQPGHMSGHIVYGQALFESGELEEARTVFETALELDPENLIALRHLGDIALRAGDRGAARSWYERVLETDPRNEEISGILQGMAPAAPAAADPPPPPPPASPPPIQAPSPLDTLAPEFAGADDPQAIDLDAPVSGVEIIPAHTVAPTAYPGDQPLELIDLSADLPASPQGGPSAITADAGAPDLLDLDAGMFGEPAGGDHPPLDISTTPLHTDEQETESAATDAFLLDGLEPTHFEGSSAEQTPPSLAGLEPQAFEPPAPEVQPERISQAFPALEDFSGLSHENEPGDSTPLQSPPASAPPTLGELPFIDTGAEPNAEQSAEPSGGAEPPRAQFPEFEPAPEPGSGLAAGPIERSGAAATVNDTIPARPTPSAAGAFVTETMAELYIQQGFLDRAAAVYRQLLDQRPDDAGLRERLHAVEAQVAAASAPVPAPASTPVAGGVAVEEGPSIREFLGRFAARRPRGEMPYVPTPPQPQSALPDFDAQGGEPPMEIGSSQVEPATAEGGEEELESAPALETPPGDAESPEPGSISAIFGQRVSDDDEARATRLAAAFSAAAVPAGGVPAAPSLPSPVDAAEGEPVLPASGRPARPAETELSLDRVFRDPRPATGARGSAGFSFDQFFSKTDAPAPAAPAPRTPEHGEAPAAGADDIAQFNAWLQGLKNK